MALGEKADFETSLRDDLAASLADIEAREAVADEPVEPVDEADVSDESPVERDDGREANGRFKAKESEDTQGEPTHVQTEDQNAALSEQSPAAAPSPQPETADAPPQSWRADEAKEWASLSPAAKNAIIRREESVAKLVGTQDGERMFGREIAEVIRPHKETLDGFGVSPQFAIKVLLDNDKTMRSGSPQEKVALARRMMNDYGVDPQWLAQPDPNMPSDPHVAALQHRIDQLQASLNRPAEAQQFAPLPPSENENTIAQTIEAFRSDPAHPHFAVVQPLMARLLETEAATDLTEAYHMAVASRPDLRSTATAPTPDPQRIQQDKTLAARRASASVSGSLGATGSPQSTSLREELREQLRANGFTA